MQVFRARTILPISAPPIEDGAVCVRDGKIEAVGAWKDLATADAVDLGDVVLMPGLINAHCHLDYSDMRGAILSTTEFSQWIRRLNDLKRTQTDEDYLAAISRGLDELRLSGTTTVFNIESYPELLLRIPRPSLRVWWMYELLDIRNRIHTEDVVAGALAFFGGQRNWLGGFGLSPHAPYTTSQALYELTRECCEKYGMPFTTHLAETDEEFAMFVCGSGQLYGFLASLGRNMSDTGGITPVAKLLGANLVPKGALLAHMNVLADSDWDIISRKSADFSVVHCPNCHEYFQRPPFPLEEFLSRGVNVCLGTDSLASNRCLNMFVEMRSLRRAHPEVTPRQAIEMATIHGAQAIGQSGKLGEITPGAEADLIALPIVPEGDVWEAVVHFNAPVEWTMVGGQRVD